MTRLPFHRTRYTARLSSLARAAVLALPLAFLFGAAPASAAFFIVNNDQDVIDDNPGDGICHALLGLPGVCTLRAAIMEANALDEASIIGVPSGLYLLNRAGIGEDNAQTGDLDIFRDITLFNATSDRPSLLGLHSDRIFDVRVGGTLTINNLHVSGGYANSPDNVHGGAVRVAQGASLHLENAVLATNLANIGGAIYSDGTVTVVDTEFYNNAVAKEQVLPEFANGAAILSRGTLEVERSTFRDNGVIPGADTIDLVVNPYAVHARNNGPADPMVTMVNTTIADNTRGVRSEGVPMTIWNSTIAGNGARGLTFNRDLDGLGLLQLSVRQTVIVDHAASDCNSLNGMDAEYDVRNRNNASGDATCGFSGGADAQDIDYPFFGPLAMHGGATPVLMPRPESAIVDTGGVTCASNEDQRGTSRPLDGNLNGVATCDIGAVEFDADSDPVDSGVIFADGFE